MNLIITVDTEADNQWKTSEVSLENIRFLKRFDDLCKSFNFPVSYLVTYEVASDKESAKILKKFRDETGAEIGAHLHPWTNPPFNEDDKISQAFPSELNDKIFYDKLLKLTGKIEEKFEKRPVSFRAGRWGFDSRLAKYLFELGYAVDCSITPKVNWANFKGLKDGKGGPDFTFEDILPGYIFGTKLLEIPMTIINTRIFFKDNSFLFKRFLSLEDSLLKKILNKVFFNKTWFRIFSETKVKDLIKVCKSAKRNKLPVIEFMIHSSELMPGGSPYAKDNQVVEKNYQKLEGLFKYLKKQKIEGITLSDFALKFKKYENK